MKKPREWTEEDFKREEERKRGLWGSSSNGKNALAPQKFKGYPTPTLPSPNNPQFNKPKPKPPKKKTPRKPKKPEACRISYVEPWMAPPDPDLVTPAVWGPGDYEKYMQSATWRHRKLRFYAKHAKTCRICKKGPQRGVEIHLHHLSYESIGDEPDEDLMPLCQVHHDIVHANHRTHRGSLREATARVVEQEAKKGERRPRRRRPSTDRTPL